MLFFFCLKPIIVDLHRPKVKLSTLVSIILLSNIKTALQSLRFPLLFSLTLRSNLKRTFFVDSWIYSTKPNKYCLHRFYLCSISVPFITNQIFVLAKWKDTQLLVCSKPTCYMKLFLIWHFQTCFLKKKCL